LAKGVDTVAAGAIERPLSAARVWRDRIVGHADMDPRELTGNPRNWRRHPKAQADALEGALDAVGWVATIMVNRRTGLVVDGHLRLERAIAHGEASVPVTYVELDEGEEALVLATLDPLGAMAETDQVALDALLADVDVDGAGLEALLAGLRGPVRGMVDPDEVPPTPAEPWVKSGDLFALGQHRLLCGDATKPEGVARLLGEASVDCIWTDPPYGVDYVGKTDEHLTLENDGAVSGPEVFGGSLSAALEHVSGGAPLYCAAPAGPRNADFRTALAAAGWRLHQELVWVKDRFVLGHSDYHYQHEPLLYGYAPGAGRSGRGRHKGTRWHGDNAQSSVLNFERPARSAEHPTMKPVGLVELCLRNSTASGDAVYDPFVGSGTTLIAAETLGRRCYAMEIDPRYVQVALERWQNFTGRTAERIDG
jgi:DNA modification methylase